MHDSLKDAILRPLLKMPKLDLVFPNFRHVSNLAYLGKLAEMFASQQLMRYAELMDMMEPFQSDYRQGFSTETALLQVKTDILDVIDRKEVTCLVMLGLSTAYDTISHKLLINCLKYCFGITDTILQVTCLVMLGLSMAFDAISHKLLINCLKYHFGITDTLLQWISSYLTNRSQ